MGWLDVLHRGFHCWNLLGYNIEPFVCLLEFWKKTGLCDIWQLACITKAQLAHHNSSKSHGSCSIWSKTPIADCAHAHLQGHFPEWRDMHGSFYTLKHSFGNQIVGHSRTTATWMQHDTSSSRVQSNNLLFCVGKSSPMPSIRHMSRNVPHRHIDTCNLSAK